MVHAILTFVIILDIIIVIATVFGFVYAVMDISKSVKARQTGLTKRDWKLIKKYGSFFLFSLLDFIVDWAVYVPIHNELDGSVYVWLLSKRIVLTYFTYHAITDHINFDEFVFPKIKVTNEFLIYIIVSLTILAVIVSTIILCTNGI